MFDYFILRHIYWFSKAEIDFLKLKSRKDADKYISQAAYQANRPTMDEKTWNEILKNKYFAFLYFKANKIPQPLLYGLLFSGTSAKYSTFIFNSGLDLINYLNNKKIKTFILKPIGGGLVRMCIA